MGADEMLSPISLEVRRREFRKPATDEGWRMHKPPCSMEGSIEELVQKPITAVGHTGAHQLHLCCVPKIGATPLPAIG